MEVQSYQCNVCGLIAPYRESLREKHYKGNPPNCPSCHRSMSLLAEETLGSPSPVPEPPVPANAA